MKLHNAIFPLLPLFAASASGQNLILNGDFETGLTGSHNYTFAYELGRLTFGPPSFGSALPESWSRGPDETRGWTVSDLDLAGGELSGDYAFRLDANTAGNPNGVPETLRQGGLNLASGQEYLFRLELAGGEDLGARIVVELVGTGANEGIAINLGTFEDTTEGAVQEVSTLFIPELAGEYELQISAATTDDNHPVVDNLVLQLNVPDRPEEFTGIIFGEESVTLTWNSIAGATYSVDYSEDLVTWIEITDSITGEGGDLTFEDVFANREPAITAPGRLFYRFRRPSAE